MDDRPLKSDHKCIHPTKENPIETQSCKYPNEGCLAAQKAQEQRS